jgi:2-oxoglutarate ferredoxin oxidoreductase subunit alpha
MAPAGVQEAVEMVMMAFPLAEEYRNPVMILGDGMIGQMMEPVEFPQHLTSQPSNKDEWATNGMAIRNSESPNVVKTLILDPKKLNEHNLLLKSKYERMKREEVRYEPCNLDSEYRVLIVSYGTMSRVCRSAIDVLKQEGFEVGMVRPQTLFPFPERAIEEAASKECCEVVVSIEMSMGQMVEDVERSVRGRCPVEWYGTCGGEVPTPEEIIEVVRSLRP